MSHRTFCSFSKMFIPAYVPVTGRPRWKLVWHWGAAPSLSKWGVLSWNRTMSDCLPLCPYPLLQLRHQSRHFQPERCMAAGWHLHTALLAQSDTPQCGGCLEPGSLGANAIPVRLSVGCNQPKTLDLQNFLLGPADIFPAAYSGSLSLTPLWTRHLKKVVKLMSTFSL